MTLEEALQSIRPADGYVYAAAEKRWDGIAKPLHGLGRLEEAVCCIAAAQGGTEVDIGRRALAVFCADNGVVAEGVSQSGSEVTAIVAQNLCAGATSVCRMAQVARCDVVPVDVGIAAALSLPGLRSQRAGPGTQNIATGPAMTQQQLVFAIEAGISIALELAAGGHTLLAAGEMGIGNTTTSSAVASVLLAKHPEEVTGRGAGLTTAGLHRKVQAIRQALDVNFPDPADPLDVLGKVGGFDIAAMCGFYLGAAAARRPVVLDGFISGVAALCAVRLCPAAKGYMLASHQSAEPAAGMVLQALGLEAPIQAGLHLGEGTGAVAMIPLLDMALAVYNEGKTFMASALEPYTPLE